MANFGNFRVVGTPYFMGPILPPSLPEPDQVVSSGGIKISRISQLSTVYVSLYCTTSASQLLLVYWYHLRNNKCTNPTTWRFTTGRLTMIPPLVEPSLSIDHPVNPVGRCLQISYPAFNPWDMISTWTLRPDVYILLKCPQIPPSGSSQTF
jgi:hypothetical protein